MRKGTVFESCVFWRGTGQRPLTISPALSARELSISGQGGYSCRISLSSLKRWGNPGWGTSGATGAILSAGADASVETQGSQSLPQGGCQPVPEESQGTLPRRWKESQPQHRRWLMNSGREKRYQFLEKKEKAHLQRLLSDSNRQECGFGRNICFLKKQNKQKKRGIILKLEYKKPFQRTWTKRGHLQGSTSQKTNFTWS